MDSYRAQSFDIEAPADQEYSSGQPVNLAHLRRYTLGDKALEDEVLQLFLTQLPLTLAALGSAATERDWKIAAHTLKGASRAVGAWRIARMAQLAEELAGNESKARSEVLAKLDAAASEASRFIQQSEKLG